MLASVNFISSELHDNQARIYRREKSLREAIMRVDWLMCASCGELIPRGARFANAPDWVRLCGRCYSEMPAEQAEATVRFETIRCVPVRLMCYREVRLHIFVGEAVVVFRPDGRELRFLNLAAAQAWVDWEIEHGGF